MSQTLTAQRAAFLPGVHEISLQTHLVIPMAVWLVAVWVIAQFGLDHQLAKALFAFEGGHWALRDAFLTEDVVHRAGHDISIAAWVAALVFWVVALRRERLRAWRRPLGYLLLAVLVSTLMISAMKAVTNMDCPWDVQGLGGNRPYVPLFMQRPAGLTHGRCFPAGHASAGYAWMALYFAFLMIRPRWRWYGLAVGAATGLIFGITQQLRGAHFLSHDLWTAMICWTVALLVYLWLRPKTAPVPA